METNDKLYWTCIIGAADIKEMKPGCDLPMRTAARNAFFETIGRPDDVCWSGWGTNKDKADVLNKIGSMNDDDPIYRIIKKILELKFDSFE